MTRHDDDILARAASWHAASEGNDMDWDGFTAWLEADPRHARAYDEIALADALLDDHRPALAQAERAAAGIVAANDAPAPQASTDFARQAAFGGWKRWTGIAIAASLALALAIPQFLQSPARVYTTDAAARRIALDDGSSVLLAPRSRLAIAGDRQERMELTGGAWFDIRHDPSRPLAITAGDVRISDIGTRFDVQAGKQAVRVEVAEGSVQVSGDALTRPIALAAGKGVLYDAVNATATIAPVRKGDAGEWRSGRLTYDTVPLALVTQDLARYAGIDVTMPDSVGSRRFSGTLVIGNGETAIRDLAQLMELDLRSGAGGSYRLEHSGR